MKKQGPFSKRFFLSPEIAYNLHADSMPSCSSVKKTEKPFKKSERLCKWGVSSPKVGRRRAPQLAPLLSLLGIVPSNGDSKKWIDEVDINSTGA